MRTVTQVHRCWHLLLKTSTPKDSQLSCSLRRLKVRHLFSLTTLSRVKESVLRFVERGSSEADEISTQSRQNGASESGRARGRGQIQAETQTRNPGAYSHCDCSGLDDLTGTYCK